MIKDMVYNDSLSSKVYLKPSGNSFRESNAISPGLKLLYGLRLRTTLVLIIFGVVNLTSQPVIAGQRTIPIVLQYLKNSQIAQILTVPLISEQKTYVLDATTGLHSAVITYSSDDNKTYITPPMPMQGCFILRILELSTPSLDFKATQGEGSYFKN
jgi:hypothetical protein